MYPTFSAVTISLFKRVATFKTEGMTFKMSTRVLHEMRFEL